MFRLSLPVDPFWMDLPHGVRVRVRPLTTAVEGAAAAAAGDAVRGEDFLDDRARTYRLAMEFAAGLARYGVIEWEGVAGANGEPLALDADTVATLARHPDIGPAFLAQYRGTLDQQAAEGNGSTSGASG